MKRISASEWVVVAAVGVLAGCSSNGGTSGETHFVCGTTADCAGRGTGLECHSGECVPSMGSGGTSGAEGGTDGSGGSTGGAKSLEGTWDVLGSQVGYAPKSTTVTLSANELTIVEAGGYLHAVKNGERFAVTTQFPGPSGYPTFGASVNRAFEAHNTVQPGDLGIVPIPLFGSWAAGTAANPECNLNTTVGSVLASCGPVGLVPRWAPDIGNGTLTGVRSEAQGSVYGDFGGKWTVNTSRGLSCSLTILGASITGSCDGAPGMGSFDITFDQDVVHGSTSQGIEFTAQRR